VIDPLVALGILAIYTGSVFTAYFGGLRPEIWQLRTARRAFHDTYAEKVTQLRGRAEYALLTTIYGSAMLKEVFDRRSGPALGSKLLTDKDRAAVEKEIDRITQGLREVTDPRVLFDGVCADYDAQASALESVVGSSILLSFLVPVVVGGVWAVPTAALAFWGFIALIVVLAVGPQFGNRWQAYTAARNRRNASEIRLIKAVDERILMPPSLPDEIPPAVPPAAAAASGPAPTSPLGVPSPAPPLPPEPIGSDQGGRAAQTSSGEA
jgi:hypothetical protein